VAWAINPHMRVGAADPTLAIAEHARFVRTLRARGAEVIELPFIHGAFDSVFMKDSMVAIRDAHGARVLPATSATAERAGEFAVRAAQLVATPRFGVAPSLATPLEGGDLAVVPHRDLALVGHGVRTDVASAPELARFLGCEVVPLRLVRPDLFHLDTALTVLADDTLVVCKAAFDRAALQRLYGLRFRRVVEVSLGEAAAFALNVVELDDGTIVTGTDSPTIDRVWRGALGREVALAPLTQFQLAGGSAACLVARVTDLTRVRRQRSLDRHAA
jgi:N-dimethylarginine dimethylaminohydrolase